MSALLGAPVQLPAAKPAALMLMLTSVSVKLAAVNAMALVLLKVKVIVEVPSAAIDVGRKALAMVAGSTAATTRFAVLDTAPIGAWVLDRPVVVVLGLVPAVVLVTVMVTVQLPFAGTVMPVNVSTV